MEAFSPTHGILEFKNIIQLNSDSIEKIVINIPKPVTIFPQGIEAIDIPILPITVNKVFINEEADPASPFCWSKSTFVLKGFMIVPDNDKRTKDSQKKTGPRVPTVITKTPLKVDTLKTSDANRRLFILLKNLI